MKIYILLLTIALLTLKSAQSQTNISGGIFSNATWSLVNSPYIVTDTVVIFPNVTLTIQPGVVVLFNDYNIIENRGTLISQGTITDSIVFSSTSASPVKGIWGGIVGWQGKSKFEHCYFAFADKAIHPNQYDTTNYISCTFNNNNIGIYYLNQNSKIDSCKFLNNTYGLLWGTGGAYGNRIVSNSSFIGNNNGMFGLERTTIKDCLFDGNIGIGIKQGNDDSIYQCTLMNNDTAIFYGGTTGYASITNNVIENNNYGIIVFDGFYISCNRICNNSIFNIVHRFNFNTSMEDNFWCSNDSATIASTIYDGYDNFSYGLIDYVPFDTIQCYLTTGIKNENKSVRTFSIYPNPLKEFGIIQFENRQNQKHSLTIHNSLGEILTSLEDIVTDKIEIERGNLISGFYFFQIHNDQQIIGTGKFIVE